MSEEFKVKGRYKVHFYYTYMRNALGDGADWWVDDAIKGDYEFACQLCPCPPSTPCADCGVHGPNADGEVVQILLDKFWKAYWEEQDNEVSKT